MERENNKKRKEREQKQSGRKPYERHTFQQKIQLEEYDSYKFIDINDFPKKGGEKISLLALQILFNFLLFSFRYFAMSQHPDEKERIQIGEQLGLDPARVKFWLSLIHI